MGFGDNFAIRKFKNIIEMKRIILTTILAIAAIAVNADVKIKGVLNDFESGNPIEFGTVRVLTADSVFVKGVSVSDKGAFSVELEKQGSYVVECSGMGYETVYVGVNDLEKDIDLGSIKMALVANLLDEVTVEGAGTIRKIDRQVILPSDAQRKASTTGISLVQHLQLSRISVNAIDKTIKTTTDDDVQLRINGVPATKEDVASITAKDVTRIDYYDNPGLRFGNAAAVLDFIVKRRDTGGSINGDFSQGVSNLGWGEHHFAGKYNFGNSSIGASAYWGLRNLDWTRENYETFNYPTYQLYNKEVGSPTKFKRNSINLNLNYSYVQQDKSLLNIAFRNGYIDTPNSQTDRNSVLNQDDKTYSIVDRLSQRENTPSLDIYYQRNLKRDQYLYFDVVGTYINSESHRNYSMVSDGEDPTKILSDIDGHKYSIIGEGIYEKNFKKGKLTAGLKHTQAYVENQYSGEQNTVVKMTTAETYAFGEFQSKVGKVDYSLGVGVMRTDNRQDGQGLEKYIFRPTVSLSYRPNDKFFVRYNGYVSGYAPSLSDLNNITQSMDAYQVRMGNPNLHTVTFYSNTLSFNWNSRYVSAELFGRYSYDHEPMMESISFDGEKFVRRIENQGGFHRLNTQLNLQINPLNNYLFIRLAPFFNRYISYGNDYTHTLSAWGIRGSIMGMYKNWSMMVEVNTRDKSLWAETIETGEFYNSIAVGYNKPNWAVQCMVMMPFSKHYEINTENVSKLASSYQLAYSDDLCPMFAINVSFNLDFGHRHNATNKRINNSDNTSGVLTGTK